MTSKEIRRSFLAYFEEKGHLLVPSSPLIPHGDPTLLLTTAGMVQFKPYFLGEDKPPRPRLTSCQKCFRATDIEAVGDSKHLTFFEMLGNFSIGDYFKQEAIAYAWEFITRCLGLQPEHLWITIYLDDEEAFQGWREVGVPPERILRFGEKENFWGPAGATGPCGPCSEIHYDFGDGVGCGRPICGPNCDCERFLEIWNLVFMQYYQDAEGKRTPLPRKNIDTGMGLERIAAVMQGTVSVFDTDLFGPIVQRVSEIAGREYGKDEKANRAIRVVAEHVRAAAFLIADGVIPSNVGRGYVLRRVMRRALRFGRLLGVQQPLLAEVAHVAIELMAGTYPELRERHDLIVRVVEQEETRFGGALRRGLAILDGMIGYRKRFAPVVPELLAFGRSRNPGYENVGAILEQHGVVGYLPDSEPNTQIGEELAAEQISEAYAEFLGTIEAEENASTIDIAASYVQNWAQSLSGSEVFVLYDTYGFPKELTAEITREQGFAVDEEGFEAEMERQRERARAAQRFALGERPATLYEGLMVPFQTFLGYDKLKASSRILALLVAGEQVEGASQGQEVELVSLETPFYGEAGGQVGDTGEIRGPMGKVTVLDTVRPLPELILHRGRVAEGSISVGDEVELEVDATRRQDTARNHTATHLLHTALRRVLGSHVQQMGSLVAPDRLRFDFSHLAALAPEELTQVERLVNEKIRENLPVSTTITSFREAQEKGALAFFGEKYGEEVRLVEVAEGGDGERFSAELCGGTHVRMTGDIGFFHIVSEGSIGAGLRRIEAVTGRGAEDWLQQHLDTLEASAHLLQTSPLEMEKKVSSLLSELSAERKRAAALQRELSRRQLDSLLAQVQSVDGVSVLAAKAEVSNREALRELGDWLRARMGSGVLVLGAILDGRPHFLAMVTPDLVARGLHAGEIVKKVAAITGGKGGGRPELAQAGGRYKEKLAEALSLVVQLVRR